MLRRMDALMCLRAGATIDETRPLLRRHHVRAVPMHPGTQDRSLALWFALSGPDEASLQAAVQALQVHPAVDAAMLKPAGEAPG